MHYKEFLRAEKLRKLLDYIAYGSLVLDFAIAIVTLISINVYSPELYKVQYLLNLSLSAEVVITAFVFVLLVLHSRYEKLAQDFLKFRQVLGRKNHRR